MSLSAALSKREVCSVAEDSVPVSLLENSQGWRELTEAVEDGRCAQSLSVTLPAAMQQLFVERFGKLRLGDGPVWNEGGHPDLIYAGSIAAPPGIDECRKLQGELALHPLQASMRIAVVWCADKLSPESANSLLKLTEEPPEHGCVVFVSEEGKLLPTIKSRVWSIHIDLPEELVKPRPVPVTPEEWAAWLEEGKKSGAEILYLEMDGWIKFLTEKGDYVKAAEVESLTRLMEQKRLSVPMIQDLAFAVLKEGIPYEQISGSIW